MSDLAITGLLVLSLFLILGSGVWIGLTLSGVAWIGMQLFSARPAGDAMAVTIWGSASSWTLTALPLFIWMGEILFRTRLSQDMFKGLAPWVQALPQMVTAIASPAGRAENSCMAIQATPERVSPIHTPLPRIRNSDSTSRPVMARSLMVGKA